MRSVFVSSVQRGYEDVRKQARLGIESLRMRPMMAELLGASPSSPQGALLEEVRQSDIYLLILGARYGESGPEDTSPTEDEFNEAVRLGKPILVLAQDVQHEPAQAHFLRRVRGAWKGGRLSGSFTGAGDVSLAVVRALTNLLEVDEPGPSRLAETSERVRKLLLERLDERYRVDGSRAFVAIMPLVRESLIDDIMLEDPMLCDKLAALIHSTGLLPRRFGVMSEARREGFFLEAGEYKGRDEFRLQVGIEGSIVTEGSVEGGGPLGSMRIHPTRLEKLILASGDFTLKTWELIDRREEVQYAVAAVGIPEADHKLFSAKESSKFTLGTNLPHNLIAPDPPVRFRRAEIGTPEYGQRLIVAVRRRFSEARAVE